MFAKYKKPRPKKLASAESLIDKVNRYRTIEEWRNGNSNSQKRKGRNCSGQNAYVRMVPHELVTRQLVCMEKAIQRKKSSGSPDVTGPVCWKGAGRTGKIMHKDGSINELVAIEPN